MSKFKNRLMKRALALILSGAMIMSDAALYQMTAFAAETENVTGEGYEDNSEEYEPEAAEITVKEDGDSDEKDADEGNVADDTVDDAADDDKNDDAADSTADDDKNNDAADDDKNDDAVPETVAESTEDADNVDDSDEKATDSAVDDAAVAETTVEDDPQETEVEENTVEETSEVEVTEEVVDNQASSKKFSSTSDNLKAGTKYGDAILEYYVLEEMVYKTSSGSFNGTSYKGVVAGTTNPYVGISDTPDEKGEYKGIAPSDTTGWIPDRGAVFKIKAIKPSTITFVVAKAASTGKYYRFVKEEKDEETGEIVGKLLNPNKEVPTSGTSACTQDLDAGETYYFYVSGSKVSVYEIKWEEREVQIDESTRTPWNEVAKPVVATPVLDETDPSKINVTVTGDISVAGADSMKVSMYKADEYNAESTENEAITSLVSAKQQNETTFTFAPTASGTYIFVAELIRQTQLGKEIKSDPSESIAFTCPLVPPTNLKAESLGNGKVQITWDAVPEVDKYIVEVVDNPDIEVDPVDGTSATVTGLTKGQTYSFTVCSVKGEGENKQISEKSEPVSCKVTDVKLTWENHRYGNGIDTSHNKISKISDTSVRLESSGGKGKIVPASTDGLSFYCTKVPAGKNFTFSANAHVNSWTFSNGQEGFGVMAADRVGKDGTGGEFWNNSYQAVISRISYKWNGTGISTDDTGEKIEMQIGVGSTEKVGVTSSDVTGISKGELEVPKRFRAGQTAIDSTYAKYGAGQYNIVAKCSNKNDRVDLTSKDHEEYQDFYLQIQRNNTGYFVSYTKYQMNDKGEYILDADGNKILDTSTTTTAKYYEWDALNVLDKDYIYVGVFTSRNADVTFSEMTLEAMDPDDTPPEAKEVKYYNLATSILSSTVTNSTDYQFIFHSNWNGKLVLKDSAGKILSKHKEKDNQGNEVEIDYYNVTGSLDPDKACLQDGTDEKNTKVYIDLDDKTISIGKNVLTVEYTPDKSWCPDQIGDNRYAELNSYDKVTLTHIVEYRKYGEQGQTIYVSQYGNSTNIGTKESPLDIYTAVKYAQPGQTILLAGGTYHLNRTLQTPRGVDGKPDIVDNKETYKNYIKMMAEDPENRPVLDFMSLVPAVVTVGNYWYFKNIDVTRCKDGEKGIQVSSSHCVFDRVDTYKNGSTGLQISRLASQDTYQDWPSDNLILNCNSYLNVDSGYEDADGFAAKLTSGSNNVFDGCIAAFNADDGWDLFAKVQSGSIGAVKIQNCIAYRNGYVLEKNGEEGNFDEFGKLRKGKGNGNGFKMGGDGLQGGSIYDADYDENASVRKSGHKIYNSLAFYNKMKGFDSNSCPNVKAYNCVSFNNEGSNVGFTSAAKNPNTDFELKNVVSFRTTVGRDQKDSIASTGTQDKGKWTNTSTYLWDASSKTSKNSSGKTVSESDFVSLEYESLNCVDLKYWRNPDGTVNTHGFLSIKEESSLLAKPSMGGTASNDIEPGDDTYGNITGAIESTDSTDDYGEDFPESGLNVKDKVEGTENEYEPRYFGKIWVADIKYLDYTDREPIEYTGKQIMPELHVRFSADVPLLRKGKDYTVKYENNINAGTATVHVIGVGNYKGFTTDKTFEIKKIAMTDNSIAIPSAVAAATSADPKKLIKPTWQGKALKESKDYRIDSIDGDSTKVRVVGIGNFGDNDENSVKNYREVTIIDSVAPDKLISKANVKITIPTNKLVYTASEVTPSCDVTLGGTPLERGTDYTVEYANNIEIGKATLTVVGNGTTYFGSKSINFNIKGGQIQDAELITIDKGKFLTEYENATEGVTFNGTDCAIPENTIKLSLKANPDVKLVNGVDYKIVQKGTNKAGNATVTIKGINGYTGSITYKFKIKACDIADLPVDSFVYFDSLSYVVGGAKYDAGVNFNIKMGDYYVDSKHYTLGYKNNAMVGKASDAKAPTVVVKGRNGLTGTKELPFNITQVELTNNTDIVVSAKDIVTNGKLDLNGDPVLYSSDLKRSTINVTQSYMAKGIAKTKKLSAGRDYDKTTIEYYIDMNNNYVIDPEEDQKVDITAKNEEIALFKTQGYVTALVRVYALDNPKCNYSKDSYVDGYFRVAMYDINKAKVVNNKSRVYGMNWKDGNGLSVAIDWSDVEVAKIEDYIDIRYKIAGETPAEDSNLTEEEKQIEAKLGKLLSCNDRIGDYKRNLSNAAKYYAMDGFVIDTDSYKKNDRVGTASFTIIGTGKFAGTKKVTFKIVNKETAKKLVEKGKGNEVEPIKVAAAR